ncbi:S-layer homology domain-containing protein [Gracilibacillus ureilyticus]|uniref:S-layer homology domain-containing protein n=1 Tax=Gracilibacillus ureilyticus TaxID=531814 RepID=A0A1H9MTW7_9BACI|nr:choice-of-anchor I family protein [Gracilibacillus ureilyticus]SER27150.1 S-layer homology domain-containing protein [Gracilibacillus ureilyticus]
MNFKKKLITGAAAASIFFTAAVPFNVLAEEPPFFQYEGKDILSVSQIGQYDSGLGEGGTEIMAYDHSTRTAFVTNGTAKGFDILQFGDLVSGEFKDITTSKRVLLSSFGINGVDDITSIAVNPVMDVVAITAVSDPKTDPGYVIFTNKKGEYITHVQVGALPDMVTFTPDGNKAIVANEGEPSDDYSMDPPGSISIIHAGLSVNTLEFTESQLDEKVRTDSEGTVLEQLEPEYVTVSDDSTTAYVSLQENNAIATIDLVNEEIIEVKGLGVKDHSVSGNELDAIEDGEADLAKQPLLGFYMPDAIDTIEYNGKTFILTPNEGDARDYEAYSEEGSVGDIIDQIDLNAEYYQGYTQKELDTAVENGLLDELEGTDITLEQGENSEGVYEALYSYGGRSFSIFDAETMELVYDSGSDFEEIILEAIPEHFNTNNDELEYDGRSDSKGPEPETIISGEIDGSTYAFVALERFSGIMIYDLSNPVAPEFVSLISSRDFSEDVKGDVSPEGLQFIAAEDSPTGKPLLAATHEISGTVAIYEFSGGIPEAIETITFNDIQGHWAQDSIESLATQGIISGYSAFEYGPEKNISRGEVAVLIDRALELESNTSDSLLFKDVEDTWYKDSVDKAVNANLLAGYDDKTFRPHEEMSREEIITVIARAYEYAEDVKTDVNTEEILADFVDAESISDWARQNVAEAIEAGLVSGVKENEIQPEKNVTRAEAAAMIERLLQ